MGIKEMEKGLPERGLTFHEQTRETGQLKVLIALAKNWREMGEARRTEGYLHPDTKMTAVAAAELVSKNETEGVPFDTLIFAGGMERERVGYGYNPEEGTMTEAEAMLRYALRVRPDLVNKIGTVYLRGEDGLMVERELSEFFPYHKSEVDEDISEGESLGGGDLTVFLETKAVSTRGGAREVRGIVGEMTGVGENEELVDQISQDSVVLTVGFHLHRATKDMKLAGLGELHRIPSDEFLGIQYKHYERLQGKRRVSPRIWMETGRETVYGLIQKIDTEGKLTGLVSERIRRG